MASAAPSGKKKGRKKGKAVDLNEFLQNDKGNPDGKAVTITKTGGSWADQMDYDEEKTVVLPTAPSSVRGGLNVDLDRIPVHGPFKLFIANVSYDADEQMVASMFKGLDVMNVHLPCDDSGRFRGFGYVEFGNRDDLIEALQMDDLEVAGRKLRVDLKTPSERDQQHQSRGYSSFGRDEDRDRAEDDGDWRAGPRTAPARTNSDWRSSGPSGPAGGDSDWRSGPRGGGSDFGDRDRDRGGYGRDREPTMASKPGSKYEAVPSFNDYRGSDRKGDDRFGSRDDRFGGRDDRYGGRDDRYGDRDRGYGGGGYGYDRRGDDRGYGSRDDRYGDRDRGYGGGGYGYDRRGDDRGYGSRDDRYGDRDRGYGYDRRGDDRGYGSRDDRYGDRDRGGFDRRDDRYGDRGRDDRYGSRDGPRYDSRDGPRYDSRDGPRDGPRYDSRDGPRDGPRYDSRDGPRYDSRDGPRSDDRPTAEHERPKLNLKPRSVPSDDVGKPAASSSIFGGAKPVDTTAREREVEERLKATRLDERPRGDDRPRPSEPASGAQRRAEASRDIRLTEPARSRDNQKPSDSAGPQETNGKADAGEKRDRAPRPPKTLEDKPAVFVEQSRFSALAEDEDD